MNDPLSVPYHSQHADDVPVDWRGVACSIVNLKMVLDFLARRSLGEGGLKVPSTSQLLEEGVAVGGFKERGWVHDALVILAHNHGIQAYRQEFRTKDHAIIDDMRERGLIKIRESVKNGFPVIVSVQKENGSYHTILIIGATDKELVYHDPDASPDTVISKETFMRVWRGLAIFFHK